MLILDIGDTGLTIIADSFYTKDQSKILLAHKP